MSKIARLEARFSPDVHALLKRAAETQGRSLSDFVVSAARQAAEQAIEQAELIRLSRADQERFAADLLDPAPLAPAMERAIRRHEELVGPLAE